MTLREIPLGNAKSQESRKRFAITNDPIGAFVKEQCILDQTATTPKQELAEAYSDFIAGHGLSESLSSSFFKTLYDRLPQLKQIPTGGKEDRYQAVAGIKINQGSQQCQG
jgi:phage/plasmid-associated DNA primase